LPDDTPSEETDVPPEGADDVTQPVDATAVTPAAGETEGTADTADTGVLPPAVPDGPAGEGGASEEEGAEETAAVAAAGSAGAASSGPRHGRRRRMSRSWIIAVVSAVVVLAGAGIALAVTSGTKNAPPRHRQARSTAATDITLPATGPTCPLSGQPAPGGKVPQRPALAFKVDNYPAARPQSGLDDADIVFEEPVEGGITRYVAVFQCQGAPLVGPIRSARAVDVPILDQLSKPLFVHAGGINPVIALVNDGNLINDDVFTHGAIVQHPSGRYAPYSTYASTASAWALQSGDTTPPAALFTYSSTAPAGTPVGSIHIDFSGTNDNTWTWSPINAAWLLSIGGVPANVGDGGARITAADVVVQSVHVTYGPWLENSEGGLEVQSDLIGSGPLEVFRNGEEITGTWQRASLSDPTRLVAADGATIALAPGRTFVELVPSTIPIGTAPPVSGTP